MTTTPEKAAKIPDDPSAQRGHRTVNGHKAISLSGFGTGSRDGEVEAQHPWPSETFLQGGGCGVVFTKTGSYETAFVEAYSDTLGFLRGEGKTWQEAEDDAWRHAQRVLACPGPTGHEWEDRGYRNGGGFCRHCGRFGSNVFTPADLGCFCSVCGVPTFWHRDGDEFRCEEHTPHQEDVFACGCPACHLARKADLRALGIET